MLGYGSGFGPAGVVHDLESAVVGIYIFPCFLDRAIMRSHDGKALLQLLTMMVMCCNCMGQKCVDQLLWAGVV